MDEASDQSGGDAYLYALRDQRAYLQTDDQTDDQKPAIIARPPPDPAQFKCWFCRKSHQQVQMLSCWSWRVRGKGNETKER